MLAMCRLCDRRQLLFSNGVWRSLVARLGLHPEKVAGSNPVTPTLYPGGCRKWSLWGPHIPGTWVQFPPSARLQYTVRIARTKTCGRRQRRRGSECSYETNVWRRFVAVRPRSALHAERSEQRSVRRSTGANTRVGRPERSDTFSGRPPYT